jgi:hypothetical protein
MYYTRTYHISGVTPLMMHNGQLANPLNPLAIELGKITKKKGKTEADHLACAKLEFLGSCYYDKKRNKFLIPDMCIEAGIKASAVAKQRGIKKTVESAILVYDHGIITDFSGPKTPLDRWEAGEAYYDQRMVVIRGRVLRTRPIFDDWKATFSVKFDDTKIDGTLLDDIITVWGNTVGMLELRPKYGRFEVVNVQKE